MTAGDSPVELYRAERARALAQGKRVLMGRDEVASALNGEATSEELATARRILAEKAAAAQLKRKAPVEKLSGRIADV